MPLTYFVFKFQLLSSNNMITSSHEVAHLLSLQHVVNFYTYFKWSWLIHYTLFKLLIFALKIFKCCSPWSLMKPHTPLYFSQGIIYKLSYNTMTMIADIEIERINSKKEMEWSFQPLLVLFSYEMRGRMSSSMHSFMHFNINEIFFHT